MDRQRGFYSLIQYIPDPGRAEAANAGVAVFLPADGSLRVRTSPTLERIRQFFKPDKLKLLRLHRSVRALATGLKASQGEFGGEEEFRRYVGAQADDLRLVTPRLVMVDDPDQTLDRLYAELVGEFEKSATARTRGVSFPLRLAAAFGKLQAEGKLWRPGRIEVPEVRKAMDIPAAYRNGKVNLITPQSLAPDAKPVSRLQMLGFNGRLIANHYKVDDLASRLVVLSADANASHAIEKRYAEVLDEFDVRFVPYGQAEAFAAEVERDAH